MGTDRTTLAEDLDAALDVGAGQPQAYKHAEPAKPGESAVYRNSLIEGKEFVQYFRPECRTLYSSFQYVQTSQWRRRWQRSRIVAVESLVSVGMWKCVLRPPSETRL